jgi:hypothetical protein
MKGFLTMVIIIRIIRDLSLLLDEDVAYGL